VAGLLLPGTIQVTSLRRSDTAIPLTFGSTPGILDETYKFGDLQLFIDQASLLHLDGVQVDYVETLEGSGFKFNNPNVKSTCGCGSSFSA
jgi:iron-sulfur cluster assembly accessory protein